MVAISRLKTANLVANHIIDLFIVFIMFTQDYVSNCYTIALNYYHLSYMHIREISSYSYLFRYVQGDRFIPETLNAVLRIHLVCLVIMHVATTHKVKFIIDIFTSINRNQYIYHNIYCNLPRLLLMTK